MDAGGGTAGIHAVVELLYRFDTCEHLEVVGIRVRRTLRVEVARAWEPREMQRAVIIPLRLIHRWNERHLRQLDVLELPGDLLLRRHVVGLPPFRQKPGRLRAPPAG